MGFEDRDYNRDGSGGGWRAMLGRVFENPDNPLTWSFKVMRAFAIDVRIHLVMVIYIVVHLLASIPQSAIGPGFAAMTMAALFGIVLLHEFGHCFACRWVDGEANRIVMLPWGGLAMVLPPHDWRSNLITTLGGPAVNVVIIPLTVAALWLTGYASTIVFNPFDIGGALFQIRGGAAWQVWAVQFIWWVHFVNLLILAFNVLLPFYPLDGGRIVQALLWRKMGFRKASEVSIVVGFVGALTLAAVALVTQNVMLLTIAVFGGLSCWMERQRIRGTIDLASDQFGLGVSAGSSWGIDTPDARRRPSKREVRQARLDEQERDEEDRILAKIANEGMQSLTRRERKFLDRLREKKNRTGERR